MHVLITGGCGFIGGRLVAALVGEGGHAVRVLDNLSEGSPDALPRGARRSGAGDDPARWHPLGLRVGDVCDSDALDSASTGAEVIVHLAASTGVAPSVEDPLLDCRTNVLGTLNALEAARHARCRRFVFASSGAPVGECNPPIHEEIAPHPASPYGASKLAGEGYCSAFFRSFGLETVALRFSNVYGPGSGHKQSVVARFISRALAGDPLTIYGDGQQTRDFIFVDDLVGAVRRAMEVPDLGGELFHVATGRETRVSDLFRTLSEVLQRAGCPAPGMRHEPRRAGDVLRNFADTGKARKRLGWEASMDLAEGLRQTVDWFIRQRAAG